MPRTHAQVTCCSSRLRFAWTLRTGSSPRDSADMQTLQDQSHLQRALAFWVLRALPVLCAATMRWISWATRS